MLMRTDPFRDPDSLDLDVERSVVTAKAARPQLDPGRRQAINA
ncbi:hypothetical protein [Nocardia terrae]|nr:hypothetical protein [Nocardia terrae]